MMGSEMSFSPQGSFHTVWIFLPGPVSFFAALFLLLINVFAFLLMGVDKSRAVRGKRRIRERTLLGLALCFGGLGIGAGMVVFRHKIRTRAFQLLVPTGILLNLVVIWLVRSALL